MLELAFEITSDHLVDLIFCRFVPFKLIHGMYGNPPLQTGDRVRVDYHEDTKYDSGQALTRFGCLELCL